MQNRILSFAKFVIRYPFLVIVLSLLAAGGLGFGASKTAFDTNYRAFFAKQNPQMAAFDELEKAYSKVDNILFTIKPKSGNVFDAPTLELVQKLTDDSWRLPHSQRVDSITNFQHTHAEADDLIVADLVENDPNSYTNAELETLKQIALAEPILADKLINPEATTTGVNVTINLPHKDMAEVPITANAARELVTKYAKMYPDIEIRPSGMVFMNNAFMESSMNDMGTLMPLMFAALLLIMALLVRSVSATFATLLVIMFSAAAAMGFGGWMGFGLTPPSAMTTNIVLTLAIADSIHIIMSMIKAMQAGMTKHEAIVESVRINMQPVFLTSFTTIIGFLSLNFAKSPPFWHLGNMTAVGIAAAFVLSVTLLPALLSVLPMRVKPHAEDHKTHMEKFGGFVVANSKTLLVLGLIITAFLAPMIKRIEVNDQFVQYFDESMSFRADSEFMIRNLSGIYTAEYAVGAKGAEQITDPVYLNNLDAFTEYLRAQPEVDHVFSVTDIFKRLNKNMHGDDEAWYKIPSQQNMAAQYLLLYEFSLPYGLDLTDRINIDKSATRITATLTDLSTNELRAFKSRTEAWLEANTPDYMHTEATSPGIMFAFISERNIQSMVKGNLLSLILISGIIMLALRSLKVGLISLVPNLLPIITGFGIWGLLIGQINMAVAFAFAACIGIIVDDTVHFLSKYMRARTEKGYDAREAVKYAFSTVGTALVVTSIILIGGFGVLTMSNFQMNTFLGMLSIFIIGSALVLDFILLPPLLILIDDILKKFKKETLKNENA